MPINIVPVFVSSTWVDLRPEREAVRDAVLRMKETQFVGMEYFGSRDETPRLASRDEVDRSLAFVCIIAGRYGSGITEHEYERAHERGLPCFIYFKDAATIPDKWREAEPVQIAKFNAFKQRLRTRHLEATDFINSQDLAARVTADLHRWLFDNYVSPKLRGTLHGEVPRHEAQALLDAVKDLGSLKQNLLDSLRTAGFTIASGERSVAYMGDAGQVSINTGDTNVYYSHVTLIPTLHQLRAPVGDFVGREKEIADLLAALRAGNSATITGINGMGGIGKTELSLYVAENLRDTYPDAQLILEMRGTEDAPREPTDALSSCIRAFLGPEQELPDDTEELTQLYRSVLDGKRALILLDDASDSDQVRPLLPPTGSALLITSRNSFRLPNMKTRITLGQLNPADARELLTSIVQRVTANTADQICYLCGYLPLAIRATGSLLDVTIDLDPETYASQLRDERTRLERIGAEDIDVSVEASFNLSYARLLPDAASVFRLLSVFPASFDANAEEAICEDEGHKHLSDLLRRNLVIYDSDSRRYRLHDLARLFANSRLSETERYAYQMRHSAHYCDVLRECRDSYNKGGDALKNGLALFDVERQNIETGQDWAGSHTSLDETAAWICNEYPNAAVEILNLRQHPRDNILWLEAALVAARQLKNRVSEGWHLSNLGCAYWLLGEVGRASELFKQYLIIAQKLGDHRGEGMALNNLGIIHQGQGENERAIECFERHLAISREINDRKSEGIALGNLGYVYFAWGKTYRAIEFYKQDIAISQEIGNRRGEGTALGNLGRAFDSLGQPRRAIDLHQRSLAIAREIGNRNGEVFALNNLGWSYASLGKPRSAIKFAKQAIVIAHETEDRWGESEALFNIGSALDDLGDRSNAITYTERGLEILEKIETSGEELPFVRRARTRLARWRKSKTTGIRRVWRWVLAICVFRWIRSKVLQVVRKILARLP
jgi:tetratricopeptide (TPR) repeat protein